MSASRTFRSAKTGFRVLKTKPVIGFGRALENSSSTTRPSCTAGKSYFEAQRVGSDSDMTSNRPFLKASK